MSKPLLSAFIFSCIISFNLHAQPVNDPIAEEVFGMKSSSIPTYISFSENSLVQESQLEELLSSYWGKELPFSFRQIGEEADHLGMKHKRYEQTLDGVPIELAEFIVHLKGNKIVSLNGRMVDKLLVEIKEPVFSEKEALDKALSFVDASLYKWELLSEERHLKEEQNNTTASYFPKGVLCYMPYNGNTASKSMPLCYKFSIYAHEPMGRYEVYVDAIDGEIIFKNELLHSSNVQGSANTAYSGVQTITTDSVNATTYRLRQTLSGGGVNTFDLNNGTNYSSAVDFIDTDNNWNNVNSQLDQYATDAHWGAEQTYDYFLTKHGRNSINNAGFPLNSYIHYSTGYANAFWDGFRMTYGDGNGSVTPLVALDIAGHEISHGLTSFSANLIYASESGALNESFSDIFGAAIEFYARPGSANWTIGEDINRTIRSMSNPNSFGDPDTYDGSNWQNVIGCTPTQFNDQCGVHTNSGVQNHWFYLLVTGGSGVNDKGNAYAVSGIGIDKAAAIAFRNLTVYLTQSSDYAEARFYSIKSASDLYGACSPEVQAVTNAWHAVGVGAAYIPGVISDFESDVTNNCSVPTVVNFTNTSNNATTFNWDFGDGSVSTQKDPTHTYTALGKYTVTLIADGGACGIDTVINTNYIDIDTNNACQVILQNGSNQSQLSCSGTLVDDGGPTGNYSDNHSSTITIAPSNASSVTLSFTSFDVEAGTSSGVCDYDYLEIFDGASTSAPSLGRFCNTNLPGSITSSFGAITIRFFSDANLTEAGFEMDWSCNYPTTPPVVDFSASNSTSCTGLIAFRDLSTESPTSWAWDFGDGNTSIQKNPTHTYTQNGTYDVELISSNSFGSDTLVKTTLVSINRPSEPLVTADTICQNVTQNAVLAATVNGRAQWYAAATGGVPLFTGNNFNATNIVGDTSFYVEDYVAAPIELVGPSTNGIGSGGNFTNNAYLTFDVYETIELVSVRVYASGSGNRTIELRDNNGNVLQSLTRSIPNGVFRLNLNFTIPPGSNYQLGVSSAAGAPNLYRNNGGVNYPYNIQGKVSIKRSSATTNPFGFYYFFYNWRIKSLDCVSPRAEAFIKVDSSCTITSLGEQAAIASTFNVYPNPVDKLLNVDYSMLQQVDALKLMDISGKLIMNIPILPQQSKTEIEVAGLSPGIYFLQVLSEEKSEVKKVIIK
jgi:Zn-dependent metalloprotease/plastocyanin